MPDASDYRQQGDLAIHGFRRMIKKYERRVRQSDDDYLSNLAQESLAIAPQDLDNHWKKNLLNRLEFSLLPLLRQHLLKINLSLGPAHLPEERDSKIKMILEGQSELDRTLNQIRKTVHRLCPHCPHPSDKPEDQHLKEFKSFRLGHLYHLFNYTLLDGIVCFFKFAIETIERLGISNCMAFVRYSHVSVRDGQHGFKEEPELNHTDSVLETIDSIIRWLKGSELDLIQHNWPSYTRFMADITAKIFDLIHPTTEPKVSRGYPYPLSTAVIQLGKSTLPLLKLSRIFINKLTKRGMNTNRLPLFTRMRTDQLKSLAGFPGTLGNVLSEMLSSLQWACTTADYLAAIGSKLTRLARKLQECFESPLVLIAKYFIPLIPDTDNQDQKYFATWFATWSTGLEMAVCNLTNAAKIFNQNPRNLRFSTPRISRRISRSINRN